MRDGAGVRGDVLIKHPCTSARCPEPGCLIMLEFLQVFLEQAGFKVLQLTSHLWMQLSPDDV